MVSMLFNDSALVFKALSHPLRLRMVNYISFSARTVEECAEKFDQSVQNISKHLKLLRELKIVEIVKVKNFHYYTISNEKLSRLVSTLAQVTNNYSVAEDDRWTGSIVEASKLINARQRLIYDLRDEDEKNYLPIPKKYLTENFDHATFLICRGPWCEKLQRELYRQKEIKRDVLALSYTADELRELIGLLK